MTTVTIPVIKTKADLAEALARIDELIDAPAGSHDRDELHALALVAEDYERRHQPFPSVCGRDLLAHVMDKHGLSQGDVPEVGAQPVVSAILAGKRAINARMAIALGQRFRCDPLAFLR